jgi:MFS family permease
MGLLQLPRTVWLLGAVSLLNDSASELVYPLLPLYLSSVLLASPRLLGLLEGVAESLAAVLKLVSGAMSDRFRWRKPPMLLGYGLAALARPLYVLVGSFAFVFALRVLDRLGKALRSAPRDALLAASVSPQQRGLAFGVHRSMDHLGAVIGPGLALLLLTYEVPIATILLWAALPGALCVGLVWAVQEPEMPGSSAKAFDWRWHSLPPALRHYLLCLALFNLGNASSMFLLLRAQNAGFSPVQITAAWAGMSAIAALGTTPLSALSDRIGRKRLIIGGWFCFALLFGAFAHAQGVHLYLLFAAMGVFIAATDGVEKALVADCAGADAGGRSFGWFYLCSGLPLLPASLIFGELATRGLEHYAFGFCALCTSVAALALALGPTVEMSARSRLK